MAYLLRRAVADDIPGIWRIRHAVHENRLSDPSRVTDADMRRTLDRRLFHVAGDRDRILGFSAAEPDDGTIWALFVDPAAEGLGLGQALLAAAVGDLVAAGHRTVRLTTDPGTRAEMFYRAAGWTCTGPVGNGEIGFMREIGDP